MQQLGRERKETRQERRERMEKDRQARQVSDVTAICDNESNVNSEDQVTTLTTVQYSKVMDFRHGMYSTNSRRGI
jgi:secreted Zn-dependent insulinase-like peptidase